MLTRVAVGIIRRDGKVLVCQRKLGARYELKWEFPGGKVEPEETSVQCLGRELREELSIELRAIDRIELQASSYDDGGTFEVAYCFVSEFDGEPTNNVFQDIRWVSLDELKTMDILEGNKNFVAQLTHE
jgi:8-oxo-dGTP diphosphatase